MAQNWVSFTKSQIYTILEYRTRKYIVNSKTKKTLEEQYPDLNFTSDGISATGISKFPSVYIQFLPMKERGMDLERDKVNELPFGIQIDVTTNKSQGINVANDVMDIILLECKKLMFTIKTQQDMSTTTDTRRLVATATRNICRDDTL